MVPGRVWQWQDGARHGWFGASYDSEFFFKREFVECQSETVGIAHRLHGEWRWMIESGTSRERESARFEWYQVEGGSGRME
jgi:hypothetical protein